MEPCTPHPDDNCEYLGEFTKKGDVQGPKDFSCTYQLECIGQPRNEVLADGSVVTVRPIFYVDCPNAKRSCTWQEMQTWDRFFCQSDCPCAGGKYSEQFVKSQVLYTCEPAQPGNCGCPDGSEQYGPPKIIPPDNTSPHPPPP